MSTFATVDLPAVKTELEQFVREAEPKNGSGDGFITTTSYARCGRPRAIELAERIRPILDALYVDWRAENPKRKTFEFSPERDAAMRLIARIDSHQEIMEMLGGSTGPRLAAEGLHDLVWGAAESQWLTGHRHEAVLAAAKAVNSQLQAKVGRRDVSEVKLVREALSEKDPEVGKARLRFPSIADDQTRQSFRQGVMDFGAGCFAAIRNPSATCRTRRSSSASRTHSNDSPRSHCSLDGSMRRASTRSRLDLAGSRSALRADRNRDSDQTSR